jgi:hypothetical protein
MAPDRVTFFTVPSSFFPGVISAREIEELSAVTFLHPYLQNDAQLYRDHQALSIPGLLETTAAAKPTTLDQS